MRGFCLLTSAALVAAADPNAKVHTVLHPTELDGQPSTPSFSAAAAASYVSTFSIVSTHPHCDATPCTAFTEGLAFNAQGDLFESNGGYHDNRHRGLRKVDTSTGSANGPTLVPQQGQFVEGLTVLPDGRVLQLTYRERQINEYHDGAPMEPVRLVRTVRMPEGPDEGWGLTRSADGSTLYLTDSTERLFHLNASSLEVIKSVPIVDTRLRVGGASGDATLGRPVFGVNELEMVGNELWGNVYPTCAATGGTEGRRVLCDHSECLVRVDPEEGTVLGWVDLTGLLERESAAVRADLMDNVLNGIAYHGESDRLLVTGKNWDNIYRVAVVPTDHDADHVESVCRLAT